MHEQVLMGVDTGEGGGGGGGGALGAQAPPPAHYINYGIHAFDTDI